MGLLMLVVGSLLTVFESVQRSATFAQERSEALDEMRLTLDRMTKEIRQATWISPDATKTNASRLEMCTYVLGVTKRVIYQASTTAAGTGLTRSEAPCSEGGGSPVVVQKELTTTSVFTYVDSIADVSVVELDLSVRPARRPDTVLVLTSQVRLRNRSQA